MPCCRVLLCVGFGRDLERPCLRLGRGRKGTYWVEVTVGMNVCEAINGNDSDDASVAHDGTHAMPGPTDRWTTRID